MRLLALFLVVAAVGPTFAQAPMDQATRDRMARTHFQAGTAYYERGEYELALAEYQRSYALSERPQLLYNLYLAHERLGHLPEAMDHLARYLVEAENVDDRAMLEARLATMRRRLADDAADAEDEGEAEVDDADREGRPTVVDAAEEETAPIVTEPPRAAPTEPGPHPVAVTAWVATGALTAGFAVAGAMAWRLDQSIGDRCGADLGGMCSPDDSDLEALERRDAWSTALLVSAGAAFVTALVLQLTVGRRERASLSLGPTSVRAEVRFP